MIEKLDVSPYLLARPRSLRQACIDVTGCNGGSIRRCSACGLAELCLPDQPFSTSSAAAEHQLERVGIRVIADAERRAANPSALVRLRSV